MRRLAQNGDGRVQPMKDWAVQAFLRGTALLCLIVVIVLSNYWRGEQEWMSRRSAAGSEWFSRSPILSRNPSSTTLPTDLASMASPKKRDLPEIVERSLVRAALWDEAKDRLSENALRLSGGQQQRLCIARALAVDPDILLVDEPTCALDPRGTARIEDLIRELRGQYTIIAVTHNMQQAARISDFTAFLYEGNLIEFGTTNEIFTRPKQKQTDDYITRRFG